MYRCRTTNGQKGITFIFCIIQVPSDAGFQQPFVEAYIRFSPKRGPALDILREHKEERESQRERERERERERLNVTLKNG